MTAIAICPTHNAAGKKDVSGAFYPEAKRFLQLHGAYIHRFDNRARKPARRREVEAAIRSSSGMIDTVAIFCHGYKNGLQTGHTTRSVRGLAEAIASVSQQWVQVALYACDAARDADPDRIDDMQPGPGGEGGFADRLRDAMLDVGLNGGHVIGHPVVAHTTKAPYVRRFYVDEAARDTGGDWVIAPGSPNWPKWRRKLRESPRFRLSFPRWTQERILEELHA